ncbi:phage antirepressor N-terminal domain-containing protein [Methylorubrum extorquens]
MGADHLGDTLFAIESDGTLYVAPKPICDALGIEWRKQHERPRRDPVLSDGITMTVMPSPGGPQETTVLRLDLVQGWLFGIEASRVRAEARDRVLAYQRECFAALHGHFYGRRVEADEPALRRREPADLTVSRRRLVAEAHKTFGPRAAGELWRALSLPIVPAMADPPAEGELGFTYTAVRQDAAPVAPAAR